MNRCGRSNKLICNNKRFITLRKSTVLEKTSLSFLMTEAPAVSFIKLEIESFITSCSDSLECTQHSQQLFKQTCYLATRSNKFWLIDSYTFTVFMNTSVEDDGYKQYVKAHDLKYATQGVESMKCSNCQASWRRLIKRL